jgi:hypothetical protein
MNDKIWSNTDSNINLFHAFSEGAEPRALCNRRIRPATDRRNGDGLLTVEQVRKQPQTHLCERCVRKIEDRAEAARLADAEAEPNAGDAERTPVTATYESGTHIRVPLGRARVVTTRKETPLFGVGSSTVIVYRLDGRPDGDELTIPADSPNLRRLCDVCDQIDDDSMPGNGITCGYCLAKIADQRIVEGVVVEHAGTAEGSLPRHAAHPDVVAAREALRELKAARLTDDTDTHRSADERDIDPSVRGYMLEPKGSGLVAAYWVERGLHSLPDGAPHEVQLDILRDRFTDAGWTVDTGLWCVFAWRPTEGTKGDVEQAPTSETFAPGERIVCGDGVVRTVEGMVHQNGEPARVVVEGGTAWLADECRPATPLEINSQAANEALAGVDFGEGCLHGQYPRPDASGDPATTCATKPANVSAGVVSDEGCVDSFDCPVQAANEAARLNAEEGAPKGDPVYFWHLMCPRHDEQTLDECEGCAAEDEQDVAAAERAGAAEAVENPEAAPVTYRDRWIAGAPQQPDDDALFTLDDGSDGEQGALFG